MPPKFIKRKPAMAAASASVASASAYPATSLSAAARSVSGGKTLIIVESPAKCRKIEGYLGSDKYSCIASYGHIREIADGLKSIDVDKEFETKFAIMSSKYQQVGKLRSAISAASDVILATDDDREGESIAWHLCQVFHLSVNTTKRIIFHEITESALKAAVAAPRTINMSVVHAQQARQILDMVVGYKVSPVLWTYIARTNLSAGRCQTPALRLVYENNKEIESSPSVMVYSVSGIFTKLNLTFHLSVDMNSKEEVERLLQETAAATDSAFKASLSAPKKATRAPPKPYSTSTLQQAANTEIHLSPKDTMSAAQKLYENGYITYMRTDSRVYSRDFVTNAFSYIQKRWGDAASASASASAESHLLGNIASFCSSSGGTASGGAAASAAHEAIRPTDVTRTLLPQSCHPREHRLYAMIWRNTLESIMAAATCQTITMGIHSPYPAVGAGAEYRYTAEQVITPGWKLVSGYDTEAKEYTYFASLSNTPKQISTFPYKKITTKCSMRNTKSHYTEAGLVQMLEKMGIGRPSTFSSLIEKIQERGYVKVQDVRGKSLECNEYILTEDKKIEKKTEVREIGGESRKLVIQPLGVIVIEFLMEHFRPLFEYEFTKDMETQLDEIAADGMVWHELCYKCWFEVSTQLKELKERGVVKEEVRIDDNHWYIIGRFGPVMKCVVSGGSVSQTIHGGGGHDDMGDNTEPMDEVPDQEPDTKQTIVFKPVRKDLEYSRILRGEYSLGYMLGNETETGEVTNQMVSVVDACGGNGQEVAAANNSKHNGKYLGKYHGQDVVIKTGKFGPYVNWGAQNISLRELLGTSTTRKYGGAKFGRKESKQTKSEFDLTLQEVSEFIQSHQQSQPQQPAEQQAIVSNDNNDGSECTVAPASSNNKPIMRLIDENTSVRTGKFGPYIFYKTPKMTKPNFIPLKGFAQKHGDYNTCDVSLLQEWVTSSSSTKKK